MKAVTILGLWCCCMLLSSLSQAQGFKINNTTNCNLIFYVAAESGAPGCSQQATNTYNLAPFAGISFMMSDPTIWGTGTPPPAGWDWSFIKIGSPSGPYSGGSNACTTPISNINVCVAGNTPCTPFPNLNCMDVTACTPVKVNWITVYYPDIYVEVTQ